MPDILDSNGLVVKTAAELLEEITEQMQQIYGADINLDSNTQDGQKLSIIDVQANVDIREKLVEVYNSCDPDKVRGRLQDVRYKINNIERSGGTFTVVPITLAINSTVTLQGLDADYNDVSATAYGGSDDSGNSYYLIDTTTLTAGAHTLPFRASSLGPIEPVVGTIVNQIGIKKEVSNLSNDSAPTSVGIAQETDEAFAIRREASTEFRAQNGIDAMRAQLLSLEGVSDAYVFNHDYENYPSGNDADGIPLHYIWVIVEGGANSDIAQTIYANAGGAGMKGAVSVDVPSASGQTFVAKFDRTTAVPLHIKFNLQETVKGTNFDLDAIGEYVATNLIYSINELAETSKPTDIAAAAIMTNGGGGVCTGLQISLNGSTWVNYIASQGKSSKFTIDASRITITEINLP